MIRAVALYALLTAMTFGIVGLLLSIAFHGPAERHALVVSATVALVVQVVSFALVYFKRRERRAMVARGIGAGLRLLTLVVYALVVVKGMALPPTPALIGMAAFLFLGTLIEPLMLAL